MRDQEFKTYLLGTATEAERTAIDRSLLTNESEFEQLLLAEDDLIEASIRHELSPAEQTQFEQFFLADPERQQKLRLALALHRYANDPSKSSFGEVKLAVTGTAGVPWWAVLRRPAWQLAMVSVLLIVALVGLKAFFNPAEPEQIAHSSPAPASPKATIAPSTVSAGAAVLLVELLPGQTRAAKARPKEIQPALDHGNVQFKLYLRKRAYPAYEVILQADDEEGQKLTGQVKPQTSQDGNYVIVNVPATVLGSGDYRIKLEGLTPNGNEQADGYWFTVKR